MSGSIGALHCVQWWLYIRIYIYTYIHTPFLPQSWFSGKWLCFPWFPFLWFQVLFHWTMILGERVIQYQDDFMDPNTKGMFLHWRRILMMKTPQGQRRCFAKFWYPKMDGLYWKTFLKWMIWGKPPYFRKHPRGCVCKRYHGCCWSNMRLLGTITLSSCGAGHQPIPQIEQSSCQG